MDPECLFRFSRVYPRQGAVGGAEIDTDNEA